MRANKIRTAGLLLGFMEDAGLSPKELGARLRWPKESICNYRDAKSCPTLDRVLADQLAKGTDRRVAEGRARSAAMKAAREKAES